MPVPVSNSSANPLGQFTDEALDAGKKIATETAKGAAALTDPRKILESILGKGSNQTKPSESPGIEDLTGGQQPTMQDQVLAAQQQQSIAQRRAEDQNKAAALLNLHRQRLQEENAYYAQSQQRQQIETQKQDQQEQVGKEQEIVQLQHEKQKEDVLGSMIKQFEGSKEQKAWGAG